MKQIFLFAAFTLISMCTFAQEGQQHETVMYDPLFWKDELSLRGDQSRKIEEINTEFYQNLRQLKNENQTQPELNKQLEIGLQERSQKIYDTLLPKQRRKLEKIIDKNAVTSMTTAP